MERSKSGLIVISVHGIIDPRRTTVNIVTDSNINNELLDRLKLSNTITKLE